MSTFIKCWLVALSVASVLSAPAAEQPPILDLREIKALAITVAGKQVSIMVTGQPPHLLTFTNFGPTQLKHRDDPDPNRVRVTYGKDLVGFAHVRADVSRPVPRTVVTSLSLIFETEEQAAAAAKALRARDAAPSPLRKRSLEPAPPNGALTPVQPARAGQVRRDLRFNISRIFLLS